MSTQLKHLADIPRRWAASTPDAPALVQDGRVLTYGELETAVEATAAVLAIKGVGPGHRVLIVNENSLALAVLFFAALRLDAWAVLVNARLTQPEIDAIVTHSDPVCCLFTTDCSPEAEVCAMRYAAARLTIPGVGEAAVATRDETVAEPTPEDVDERVAVLIYTSGTTGTPKGVMLTHRNLMFVATLTGVTKGPEAGDRIYCVLPISHVFGLGSCFLRALASGASCVLVPRFSARHLVQALADGVTVLPGVPAMHAKLLEYLESSGHGISAPKLRLVTAGGAPIDAGLKQRLEAAFGLPVINGYGLTETASTISRSLPKGLGEPVNTGPPVAGVECRIRDADGRDLAAGEAGEVFLRGANIMKGYYRNDEATRAVLDAKGWFRTGDIGRLDADGNLVILDRAKELIIRSGFNVYPADVEAVLNGHPAVTQSAVVGMARGDDEDVFAFVELAPGQTATAAEILAHARQHLAGYKVPTRLVILGALPAATTGKVLKARLREMAHRLLEA